MIRVPPVMVSRRRWAPVQSTLLYNDLINLLQRMQGHLECGKCPESGSKRGIGQVDISDIISKESKRIPQRWREGRLGVRRQCDSPELQAREMDENLEGGGWVVGRELFSSSSSGPWEK